ncbi:hypothetical protein TNCV_3258021 [Trichonephila clavipes]|nr:hypothetical protein TNCV_3258021 [Trichonephila clavipes]
MRVWKQWTELHRTTQKTSSERRKSNHNSNRYVRKVLQPEVVPLLQGINGTIFQQYNAYPHVAKTVRDFCTAQHM